MGERIAVSKTASGVKYLATVLYENTTGKPLTIIETSVYCDGAGIGDQGGAWFNILIGIYTEGFTIQEYLTQDKQPILPDEILVNKDPVFLLPNYSIYVSSSEDETFDSLTVSMNLHG